MDLLARNMSNDVHVEVRVMFYRTLLLLAVILLCLQPASQAIGQQPQASVYRLYLYAAGRAQGVTAGDLSLSCRDEKISGDMEFNGKKSVRGWLQDKNIQLTVPSSKGDLMLAGDRMGVQGTDFEGTVKDSVGADCGRFILQCRGRKALSDSNVQTAVWSVELGGNSNYSNTNLDIAPQIILKRKGSVLLGDATYSVPIARGWCATGPSFRSKSENVTGSWDANQQVRIHLSNLYSLIGVYDPHSGEIRGYQSDSNRAFVMRQIR